MDPAENSVQRCLWLMDPGGLLPVMWSGSHHSLLESTRWLKESFQRAHGVLCLPFTHIWTWFNSKRTENENKTLKARGTEQRLKGERGCKKRSRWRHSSCHIIVTDIYREGQQKCVQICSKMEVKSLQKMHAMGVGQGLLSADRGWCPCMGADLRERKWEKSWEHRKLLLFDPSCFTW